jgi:alkanesulfonate monooxygenase SsuD/methylene tetrahydromethanopterin reductase-like flavin-dependent oxidoreductase (luciferase family)
MKIFALLRGSHDFDGLRRRVEELEQLDVAGVFVGDHVFYRGSTSRLDGFRPYDPIVVLAAAAAQTRMLAVGTLVANVGLVHPAILLRHFAQLAALYGGERVYAGLGSGWEPEEFEALGLPFASHRERTERLREAAALARELFDHGAATMEGRHVVAREIPMAPLPEHPPRLLVGGGTRATLAIGGRYADHVDLNAPPASHGTGSSPRQRDRIRRYATTLERLEASADYVRAAAVEAGREPEALTFSVTVTCLAFCSGGARAVRSKEQELLAGLDGTVGSLAACPYVLLGDARGLLDALEERRERLSLDALFVPDGDALDRFMLEVYPHVLETKESRA